MPSAKSKMFSVYFPTPAEYTRLDKALRRIQEDYSQQGLPVSLTRIAKDLLLEAAEKASDEIEDHTAPLAVSPGLEARAMRQIMGEKL